MRPDKTPELWIKSKAAFERLKIDEHIKSKLDVPLSNLTKAFASINEQAILSDPFLDVKLWALSQISFETIAVPGFNPIEFTDQKGVVDAMVAPVHDTALFDGIPFDTRIVKLKVDPNHSVIADLNGIIIYGVHIGFPVDDFDTENLQGPSPKLITIASNGQATTNRRPLTGDIPIFVVSNTKSGIHKAFMVNILNDRANTDSSFENGPLSRGADWVEICSPDGRFLKVTMLMQSQLDEVVSELEASSRRISQIEGLTELSEIEREAVQSTLTGLGINPLSQIET